MKWGMVAVDGLLTMRNLEPLCSMRAGAPGWVGLRLLFAVILTPPLPPARKDTRSKSVSWQIRGGREGEKEEEESE